MTANLIAGAARVTAAVRTGAVAVVVGASCTACGACLATCPEHALRPVRGRLTVLAHCSGCLECIEVCPADAITETGFRGDPRRMAAEVAVDRPRATVVATTVGWSTRV